MGIKIYAHDLDTNLDFAITVGEGVTKEQVVERLVERMRYFYEVIQPSELFKSLNGQVFTTPLNRTDA